jgi:BatD DUF11 like domain
MVKVFITFFLIIASSVHAGNFTANVNRNQVAVGQSFTLTITLADASPRGIPNVSHLHKNFTIQSQQKSSSTVIRNGRMSSAINWQLTLVPKHEGRAMIPSISIDSSDGPLFTEPIQIRVDGSVESSRSTSDEPLENPLTVTSTVSKVNPYKNEPITYTVTLSSRQDITNIRFGKIHVEDAIVEITGEPEIVERIIDGVKVHMLIVNALITPLKSGPMIIPSITVRGDVPQRRQVRSRSFFDDDPFQMLRGFGRSKPFGLTTEEILLDVQSPVPGVTPWLPATSLKVEEQWDNTQTFQVGEPISRGFNIVAEGVRGSQLPSLKDQQVSGDSFKVYADNPETRDDIINQTLLSYKSEQYTLIPQQSGTVTLPEIIVPWWNVTTDSQAWFHIPSKTLEVIPAVKTQPQDVFPIAVKAEPTVVVTQTNPLLYVAIGLLAALLFLAFFLVFALQKRIGRLTEHSEKKSEVESKVLPKVTCKILQLVKTPKELHEYLQSYANTQWNTPNNATVKDVCRVMKEHTPFKVHSDLLFIEKSLEDSLYRDIEVDVDTLISRCSHILSQTNNMKKGINKQEKLPELNPR